MYVLCCTLNPLSNVAFSDSTLKVILIGNSAEVLTVGSYKSKNIFDGKKLQVKLNIKYNYTFAWEFKTIKHKIKYNG